MDFSHSLKGVSQARLKKVLCCLSAAFMAPEDLEIALDLARVYDKQGETRRAYARYKRVSAGGMPAEISTEVKRAMDRLRKLLPNDDVLLRDEKPPAGKGGGGRSAAAPR